MFHEHHHRASGATRPARGLRSSFLRSVRTALLLVSLVLSSSGCTSFQPVDITTAEGLQVVGAGDEVRVVTHSGAEHEFKVKYVDHGRIDGEAAHYTAAEIGELQRREYDVLASAGVAAGGVVVVYVVLVLAAAASLAVAFG